ncbi:MAG: helix-hairpin-helix domain-containing protein [Thermoanaerobaculia bacterium]|nr:helix-hairpin-helix domain-containing protein [Thermoanaerobaculia bacterium]
MRRAIRNGLAACVAILALAASPAALAAKKKTPAPAAEASSASTASDKAAKTEKVNLNTADEKAVAGAKGVGEKLAKELVKNRPYKTWEEVSKVKGVGSGKKLDSLKKVLKLTEGVAAKEEPAAEKEAKGKKTKSSSKGEEAAAAASGATATTAKASAPLEPSSPSKKSSSSSSSTSSSAKLAPGTKININTASAEELDKLPEIGPVKAQAIVDYRKANGKFASPEDIMKVPGIKEGTFAKIKDFVVVR